MPSQLDGSVTHRFTSRDCIRRMSGVCVLLSRSAKSLGRSWRSECVFANTTPLQSTTRKYRIVQNTRKARIVRNGEVYNELFPIHGLKSLIYVKNPTMMCVVQSHNVQIDSAINVD